MIGSRRQGLRLFCLIAAGEIIFALPFHLPRFFRPQLLAQLGLNNAEIGDLFALYGVTALLAYFPGGLLADRHGPRGLLVTALGLTALGGLVLATFPGPHALALLYAFFGVTTILLFWAALIRATREWGGAFTQGRAFGLLEAGRGLVAAALATVAVEGLVRLLAAGASPAFAMRAVIFFYAGVTALAALACWRGLPRVPATARIHASASAPWRVALASRPAWLIAAVVATAYCGYKGLDYYALFVQQRFGWTEATAARWFAATAWLRPLAALAAGACADRFGAVRIAGLLLLVGTLSHALVPTLAASPVGVLQWNLLVSVFIAYALRGVYFALLEEARIPPAYTGTVVGLISVVGYTPDVFFAPLAGRLLETSPEGTGFLWLFSLLSILFMGGLFAVWRLAAALPRAA